MHTRLAAIAGCIAVGMLADATTAAPTVSGRSATLEPARGARVGVGRSVTEGAATAAAVGAAAFLTAAAVGLAAVRRRSGGGGFLTRD